MIFIGTLKFKCSPAENAPDYHRSGGYVCGFGHVLRWLDNHSTRVIYQFDIPSTNWWRPPTAKHARPSARIFCRLIWHSRMFRCPALACESWRRYKVVPLARNLAAAVDFIGPDLWRFEMQKGYTFQERILNIANKIRFLGQWHLNGCCNQEQT